MKEREITALETALHYHFHRRALIEQALTHSSQAREQEAQQAGGDSKYKVSDYMTEMERFIGEDIFDYILVNNQNPPKELIELYAEEGDLVINDLKDDRIRPAALLGELKGGAGVKKDLIKRSLIRHDSKKLAQELMNIVNHL